MSSVTSSSNSTILLKPTEIYKQELGEQPALSKIEDLMASLNEKGPFLAFGLLGSTSYKQAPVIKDTIDECQVFGWNPNSSRVEVKNHIIVVGAKIGEGQGKILFVNAEEIESSSTYKASSTDTKIYVRSFTRFCEDLKKATFTKSDQGRANIRYISEEEAKAHSDENALLLNMFEMFAPPQVVKLNSLETGFANRLRALPLALLDQDKVVQQQCKKLGQEIFDFFKTSNSGNSFAGKKSAVNICDSLFHDLGKSTHRSVEYWWDGIGDDKWRWQH